jgi:hypothetical protein
MVRTGSGGTRFITVVQDFRCPGDDLDTVPRLQGPRGQLPGTFDRRDQQEPVDTARGVLKRPAVCSRSSLSTPWIRSTREVVQEEVYPSVPDTPARCTCTPTRPCDAAVLL